MAIDPFGRWARTPVLLRENEVDLLKPLRVGATLGDLRRLILDGIWSKPWGHSLAEGVIPLNRVMNEIGG